MRDEVSRDVDREVERVVVSRETETEGDRGRERERKKERGEGMLCAFAFMCEGSVGRGLLQERSFKTVFLREGETCVRACPCKMEFGSQMTRYRSSIHTANAATNNNTAFTR